MGQTIRERSILELSHLTLSMHPTSSARTLLCSKSERNTQALEKINGRAVQRDFVPSRKAFGSRSLLCREPQGHLTPSFELWINYIESDV